jgi:hypothetical protein
MIRISTILGVAFGVGLTIGGCAGARQAPDGTGSTTGGGTGASGGGGSAGHGGVRPDGGVVVTGSGCQKLQCQQTTCTSGPCTQHACAGDAKTSLSGTVYDPAGRTPLYNIIVYVPNADLDPIKEGVGCEQCDGTASGSPIASALTDPTGHFVLDNAPVGANIPLVIQIGKWRRQVTIPSVTACQDNPVADADHALLRLPRDHTEGHIPQIALATGHSDALDCLLRKIGIADSEFTPDSGTGRVHMYVGGDGGSGTGANRLASGAAFADAYVNLFGSYAKLSAYDLLILQCEGSQLESLKLPYVPNIRRYADNGGRIFDEHLHSYWIRKGLPPWPTSAAWLQSIDSSAVTTLTATIDTTFPKGAALADWLQSVQATTTRGQIALTATEHSVDGVFAPTQRWISTPDGHTQYLTLNTPLEAPPSEQCGRVVFTDLHVGSGGGVSHFDTPFPTGCAASLTMSAQEKALEFMFFDLSSCVQPENIPPIPPIIP